VTWDDGVGQEEAGPKREETRMTENTVTLTKSQAKALAEVIRSEVERDALLGWCDKIVASGLITSQAVVQYDLGVLPGEEYEDIVWDEEDED
jgi:hypothetical protein